MLERLLASIPIGEANAIHQPELAERLGCSCTTLKFWIRIARGTWGFPIMSGRAGYWIAEDASDIERFSKLIRKQAFTRLRSVKGVVNTSSEDREERRELLRALEAEDGE